MSEIKPLYSVGTWDTNRQAYTPQRGISVPSFNITLGQLHRALRELREGGYGAHRSPRDHDCNDWSVLVERTDGLHWKEIMRRWRR